MLNKLSRPETTVATIARLLEYRTKLVTEGDPTTLAQLENQLRPIFLEEIQSTFDKDLPGALSMQLFNLTFNKLYIFYLYRAKVFAFIRR
jgi:hypothetical protein